MHLLNAIGLRIVTHNEMSTVNTAYPAGSTQATTMLSSHETAVTGGGVDDRNVKYQFFWNGTNRNNETQ